MRVRVRVRARARVRVRVRVRVELKLQLGSYSMFTPLLLSAYGPYVQEAVESGFSSATVSRESLGGVLDS